MPMIRLLVRQQHLHGLQFQPSTPMLARCPKRHRWPETWAWRHSQQHPQRRSSAPRWRLRFPGCQKNSGAKLA